jgi:hypothetical protein
MTTTLVTAVLGSAIDRGLREADTIAPMGPAR